MELSPICGIEIYNRTVVVIRANDIGISVYDYEHIRGKIDRLSNSSLKRLAFVVINSSVSFRSMMTLTESSQFLNNGLDLKRRLDILLNWYRRKYDGHKYLWWLEFQKRGAPHFHILCSVDLADSGRLERIESRKRLVGLVRPGNIVPVKVSYWYTHRPTWRKLEVKWRKLGGGMTRWENINYEGGAKAYVLKYATKTEQRIVPEKYQDVGRFWGHSRDVMPNPEKAYECTENQLRAALVGWDYVPDENGFFYRELFQCADKIDVSKFTKLICSFCGVVSSQVVEYCPDCGESYILSL